MPRREDPNPTRIRRLRQPATCPPGARGQRRRTGTAQPAAFAAFTVVELVVALAIAALLATMAVPAFHDWLSAYQLANHARHLAERMTQARTEAIRRGHRVNLCKSPDQHHCAAEGGWTEGFIIFVDIDRDGHIDAEESVLGIEGPAPPGITIGTNKPLHDYVSYTSLGQARMLNGALQMGTFTLCRSGQRAMRVVLANSGRVRTERTGVHCP